MTTASTHPPTRLYTAIADLRWQEMGEDFIVFNPLSDELHRLNPLSAAALSELEQSPLDLNTLGQRMAALMEMKPGSQLLYQLQSMLRGFDEAGLIAPYTPTSKPQ